MHLCQQQSGQGLRPSFVPGGKGLHSYSHRRAMLRPLFQLHQPWEGPVRSAVDEPHNGPACQQHDHEDCSAGFSEWTAAFKCSHSPYIKPAALPLDWGCQGRRFKACLAGLSSPAAFTCQYSKAQEKQWPILHVTCHAWSLLRDITTRQVGSTGGKLWVNSSCKQLECMQYE